MDLQLLVVLALVVLSAAFLGYRMFGSLGTNGKARGCSGCAISSSCAAGKVDSRQSTVDSSPLRNGRRSTVNCERPNIDS